MSSLFFKSHAFSLYGLPEGERCACLMAENRAAAAHGHRAMEVVDPNQRTADVGELLEHCPDGLATWPVPVGVTVKPMMPGTGSGRVDLVSLRDLARNEQAAVAA